MKTIKLTKITGNTVEINPVFIETMEWVKEEPQVKAGTEIRTTSGQFFKVSETPDRIKEISQQLDYYTANKLFENEQIYYPKI